MDTQFLSKVLAREAMPDGAVIDHAALVRRMANPVCVECHEQYRKKFPDQPFQIVCDGIYGDDDYNEILADPDFSDMKYEQVRELYDKAYWANRHLKLADKNGDMKPFVARDYQEAAMRCTADRKVHRWGRGTAKTTCGEIDDLHTVTTRNNYPLLIACPGKTLAQKWFNDIKAHIENDDELRACCVKKQQAPYFMFQFSNGSTLSIFTTGSEAGRGASSIRGQSPYKVRLDEQDLLNADDYIALRPLWRRFPHSKFEGMSTPTGKREDFFEMCNNFPDYKEFFFPITVHPDWNPEMEEASRREARTEINYLHEFMAGFGDMVGGVFKNEYVDGARTVYKVSECKYNPAWKYFLGIDWNGQGTGTRYRVVGYDPKTQKRRCVAFAAVDSSTDASYKKPVDLNRTWHCEEVYIDNGYGHVQDEQIRLIGHKSQDPDDRRLQNVRVIDFGANLTTNKITPNRNFSRPLEESELERRAKPFLVEGATMCLEHGLFEFSNEDKLIEDQLRAYRVKNYSPHGWANTYESGSVGDHDLDALMLALLAVELKYGIFQGTGFKARPASMTLLAGFGTTGPSVEKATEISRQRIRATAGVPARVPQPEIPATADYKLLYLQRQLGNSVVIPNSPGPQGRGGVPSRTGTFNRPGSKTPPPYRGRLR